MEINKNDNLLGSFFEKANSIYPLSADAQYALTQNSTIATFNKKDLLWQESKIVRHAYLLLSGVVRSYYTIDGKDITANFLCEGEIIISLNSFYNNTPDTYSLECLEEVCVAKIEFTTLRTLLHNFLELNVLARVLAHQYIIKTDNRLLLLRNKSAKEKWEYFLAQHNNLVQRVSLGHIATYLGISQETLSRMRK